MFLCARCGCLNCEEEVQSSRNYRGRSHLHASYLHRKKKNKSCNVQVRPCTCASRSPDLVHAPSKLTMLRCGPRWVMIFSSDIRACFSLERAVAERERKRWRGRERERESSDCDYRTQTQHQTPASSTTPTLHSPPPTNLYLSATSVFLSIVACACIKNLNKLQTDVSTS